MRCCKQIIWLIPFLFLILTQPVQAQELPPHDPRFEALINEKMAEFLTRDSWQKPAVILELMDIQAAEQIAEIGAGEGYFTLKLAHAVGPDGKVVALDIDMSRLNKLKLFKRYGQLEQIEIVQNQVDDLTLAGQQFDKIVMVNTYHELVAHEALLAQCLAALKPGGKLYIIDSCTAKLDNDKASRKKLVKKHSIRLPMVNEELQAAGFQIEQSLDKYTVQPSGINWFMVVASKQ